MCPSLGPAPVPRRAKVVARTACQGRSPWRCCPAFLSPPLLLLLPFCCFNGLAAASFSSVYSLTFLFWLSSSCRFIFYPTFPSPRSSFFPSFFIKRASNALQVRRAELDGKSWSESVGSGSRSAGRWGTRSPCLCVVFSGQIVIISFKITFTLGLLGSVEDLACGPGPVPGAPVLCIPSSPGVTDPCVGC